MRKRLQGRYPLRKIYSAAFFFAMHVGLTSFVNSSFLSEVHGVNTDTVGILYAIASAITLVIVFVVPNFLHRIPLKRLLIGILSLNVIILAVLTFSQSATLSMIIFIPYLIMSSSVFFLNDVFLEHHSTDNSTGRTRAFFLNIMNVGWIVAPLIAGLVANSIYGFHMIYGLGGIMMIVMLLLVATTYPRLSYPKITKQPLTQTIKKFFTDRNKSNVLVVSFVLQAFYAVMVVYSPIYLHQTMDISWQKIGIILAIMLVAFPVVQIPIGRIADKYVGEKEFMILGLVITAGMTIIFALTNTPTWWVWALILFGTRIGAATVEVTTETFFFKQIKGENIEHIGLFRSASPFAYILAPVLVTVFLSKSEASMSIIFIILAIVVGLAIIAGARIHDTK